MGRRATAVMATVLATGALSACHHGKHIPDAVPTPVSTTTTAVPVDYSKVPLPPVDGRTTTSIFNGPGHAHLAGTVTGPDGAVVGSATVRVQRLVGDAEITTDVSTNLDGTWRLDNILGGRYRVRVWRMPDLVLSQPQVFFLEDRADKVLPLRLDLQTGVAVTTAIAPNPPTVDSPANLVVQVTLRAVDRNGITRATPQPATQVLLTGPGLWAVSSANPGVTDANGRATWEVVCRGAGAQPLSADVGGTSYPLTLPPCRDVPTTTTTTVTEPGAVPPPSDLPNG